MGRKPKLADDTFMPDMTVDEAKQRYHEADKKDAKRWQAIYLYMEGREIKEIAGIVDTHRENVRRWIAHAREGGAKAVPRRKPTGAPRILTRDQYIRLAIDVYNGPRKCGYKTDVWSYTLIHDHAKKKFGAEISYETIVGNMHELGFAIKSPRTSHPEAASPEERAEFQRRTRAAILPLARRGHLPLFFDEAFPQSYKNSRKTVGIKGDKTTVPTSVNRASLPLFGAVGDGFCYFRVIGGEGKANTVTCIECCERLFELFGPVQLILDHAGYHKSNEFDKFAEENRRYIARHFTIEYTPNDNSAEGQWKSVKNALSNVPLRSRAHMSKTLGKAVRAGEVPPVAVFAYARVNTRRLSPREARAIEAKIGKDEYFYYEKTKPPGRIRLPTADEAKPKGKEDLTPEMLDRIPRRLANSNLPYSYLANPPKILLKE